MNTSQLKLIIEKLNDDNDDDDDNNNNNNSNNNNSTRLMKGVVSSGFILIGKYN